MQSENESVRKAGFTFSPSSRLRSLFFDVMCLDVHRRFRYCSNQVYCHITRYQIYFKATATKLRAIQKSRFNILNIINIAKAFLLVNSTPILKIPAFAV